jgi:hypothetical protein
MLNTLKYNRGMHAIVYCLMLLYHHSEIQFIRMLRSSFSRQILMFGMSSHVASQRFLPPPPRSPRVWYLRLQPNARQNNARKPRRENRQRKRGHATSNTESCDQPMNLVAEDIAQVIVSRGPLSELSLSNYLFMVPHRGPSQISV